MTPRSAPKPSTRSRHRDEVDEVVAQSKAVVAKRPARVAPEKKHTGREDKAEELDRVLDKISRHGIASLTTGERKLLDDMSKELRDQSLFGLVGAALREGGVLLARTLASLFALLAPLRRPPAYGGYPVASEAALAST